jgi:hypothetical protein
MRVGGRGLDGRVCMISSREGESRLYDSFKIWEGGVCICICIDILIRGCR